MPADPSAEVDLEGTHVGTGLEVDRGQRVSVRRLWLEVVEAVGAVLGDDALNGDNVAAGVGVSEADGLDAIGLGADGVDADGQVGGGVLYWSWGSRRVRCRGSFPFASRRRVGSTLAVGVRVAPRVGVGVGVTLAAVGVGI